MLILRSQEASVSIYKAKGCDCKVTVELHNLNIGSKALERSYLKPGSKWEDMALAYGIQLKMIIHIDINYMYYIIYQIQNSRSTYTINLI